MKQNYISIITAELAKLDEDQLYKVLVLVKNTEKANSSVRKPSNNKPLHFGGPALSQELLTNEIKAATKMVMKAVYDAGFFGGYGIFDVAAPNSQNCSRASSYVFFCVEDKFDAMIEIGQLTKNTILFDLSIKEVGGTEQNKASRLHSEGELLFALNNMSKKYNKS